MAKMEIKTAELASAKARIALCGPPGSGKTHTALEIARGMVSDHTRIVVIDSENGSAARYADGKWQHLILPDYRIVTYCYAIAAAESVADVLIIDSISHEWCGAGGALDQAEQVSSNSSNKMEGWRVVTPIHNQFVRDMLTAKCHLIATMRTKTKWVFEKGKGGKKIPRSVGAKAVQKDGIEYEFDLVGWLNDQHVLRVTKTRLPALDGQTIVQPDETFGRKVLEALSGPDRVQTSGPVTLKSEKEETKEKEKEKEKEKAKAKPKTKAEGEPRGKAKKKANGKPQTVSRNAKTSRRTPEQALDIIQREFDCNRKAAWNRYMRPELAELYPGEIKGSESINPDHVDGVLAELKCIKHDASAILELRACELAEMSGQSLQQAEALLLKRCDELALRRDRFGIEKAYDLEVEAAVF